MKKLLGLFLAFAALGAFVYFYEIKGGEERDQAKALEEKLLKVEEDDLQVIEVRLPSDAPIRLERRDGDWRLEAPVRGGVDRFAVEALTRDLVGARRERVLEGGAERAEDYGLQSPRVEIRLTTRDAGSHVLQLGNEDYSGGNVYARLDDAADVLLTAKGLFSSASKRLKDFRSKDLLDADADSLEEIVLERKAGKIVLKKLEGSWQLEEPLSEPADQNTVSSLVSTVRYGRIQDFVAEESEDLETYGLDSPAYVARFKEGGSEAWKTIEIGKASGEYFYARHADRDPIFTLQASVAEKMDTPLWDFRSKNVINVTQEQVASVTIVEGDRQLLVAREGSGWVIKAPEDQAGKSTAAWKFWYPVDDILFETLDQQVSGELFANPAITVTITLVDGSSRTFEFVEVGAEYSARQKETGRSGRISKSSFEKLRMDPASLVVE